MGRTQMSVCFNKYRQTIFLLILFASTSSIFTAQGRAILNHEYEVNKKELKEREGIMVAKHQIGSRPPKCENRCRACGHCEAVQVPVVPQIQSQRSHYFSIARAVTVVTYSSRSDDLSNYKPMSWKCKCGDYFFNP